MQVVETNIKKIIWEVAEKNKLPLETEKEEVLQLRNNQRKKNTDRKYIK